MTRVWPVAVVLALAVLRVLLSDLFGTPERGEPTVYEYQPAPYTDEARRLLGDLAPGDELHGWTVEWVEGGGDVDIRIRLRRDGMAFTVTLAPRGREEHLPVYSTRQFDLFYGDPDPPEANLPADDVDRILNELVVRITVAEGQ